MRRRRRRRNATWLTVSDTTRSMSRDAKATVVQVKSYRPQEVKRLKVRADMIMGEDIDIGGGYGEHQCGSCYDVAQLVPKQVNFSSSWYFFNEQHLNRDFATR